MKVSQSSRIIHLCVVILLFMSILVLVGCYVLDRVSRLAGENVSSEPIGVLAEKAMLIMVLVGAMGGILTCGLTYFISSTLVKKLAEATQFMSDSGRMLADAAEEGGTDLPRIVGAQAKALEFMAEDLALFINGKPAMGNNASDPGVRGND